jgi:hypothetical protein
MNYILDPISLESIPLNSIDGKLLLKKYVMAYNKMGGEVKGGRSLKDTCHTALYGRKAPNKRVETKCEAKEYMNNLKESIKFIKNSKGIKNTTFVKKVADKVADLVNKNTDSSGYVVVLGPVEDILGFFINLGDKPEMFRRFIMLSVKDRKWSTDFNYDFINCSVESGKTDKDNFNKLNNDLPIVLINTGPKSLVKGHDPKELLTRLPRVTHCEIQWVKEMVANTSYKWDIQSFKLNGKKIWVNLLKM